MLASRQPVQTSPGRLLLIPTLLVRILHLGLGRLHCRDVHSESFGESLAHVFCAELAKGSGAFGRAQRSTPPKS